MDLPGMASLGDSQTVTFEVILVSDDRDHATQVIEDLETSNFAFRVTQVVDRQFVGHALARLVVAPPYRAPVIVMLDFAFLGEECEAVAASVAEMRSSMAVECIVTRPPTQGPSAQRLREIGAFFFDPEMGFAPLDQLVH